jgi:hypothetical protein
MKGLLMLAVLAAMPVAAIAQTTEPLDVKDKLHFHVNSTFGPTAVLGAAVYAGILQKASFPKEWGQGMKDYGKEFGSTVAASGIHSALAFGLDTTLHQDPRYFRAGSGGGFWRRSAHAFRGTILTRTDSGGETLSTWRIGSAYGAAFISNQWYPDRVNTVRLGFVQGSMTLGFGLVSNLALEFWPDVKRKVLHKK